MDIQAMCILVYLTYLLIGQKSWFFTTKTITLFIVKSVLLLVASPPNLHQDSSLDPLGGLHRPQTLRCFKTRRRGNFI